MQTTIVALLALATAASASPTKRTSCGQPSTWQCSASLDTIEVCDFDGYWKPLVPGCPEGHKCEADPFGTGIPYCMIAYDTPHYLAKREYTPPAPEYPDPAYPDPAYPDPAYPDPDPAYPDPAYPDPAYPDPAYPEPEYPDPDPAYPDPVYPDPAYPDPAYPDPAYPDPAYPEPEYPEPEYPAPEYPEPEYPAPEYPEHHGNYPTTCDKPSVYSCTPDYKAIQICDLSKKLQLVGACPSSCRYISGIPYCF